MKAIEIDRTIMNCIPVLIAGIRVQDEYISVYAADLLEKLTLELNRSGHMRNRLKKRAVRRSKEYRRAAWLRRQDFVEKRVQELVSTYNAQREEL